MSLETNPEGLSQPIEIPRMKHENVSDSPLDEQGFFKKGKVDSELIREFTCGQEDCTDNSYMNIFMGGIRNVDQARETRTKYKDMAVRLHSEKMKMKNPRIDIVDFTNWDKQKKP